MLFDGVEFAASPGALVAVTSAVSGSSWPEGFVDFYLDEHRKMVRLAYLITRSLGRAEEIAQDAFVVVA